MKGIAIGLSHNSKVILKRLKRTKLIDEIYLGCSTSKEEIEENEITYIKPKEVLRENWEDLALIIFIGSIGASVRLINSFLTSKDQDQGAVSYTHLTLPTIYSV